MILFKRALMYLSLVLVTPAVFAAKTPKNNCAAYLGAKKITTQLRSEIEAHPRRPQTAIVISAAGYENSTEWQSLVQEMKTLASQGEIQEFENYNLLATFSLRATPALLRRLALKDVVGLISGEGSIDLIR